MVLTVAGAGKLALRRARLESAALRLFRARGFDSVTVEEVCADAGVAPATFYRYFGGKEEVVFAYRRAFESALAAAIDAAATAPRNRQLGRVLVGFAEALQPMRDDIELRDAIVQGHAGLMRRTLGIQRDMERLLAEGLCRIRQGGEPDERAFAEAALGLVVLRMALRSWLTGSCAALPEAVRSALRDAQSVLAELDT